jgi:hypothetical protein
MHAVLSSFLYLGFSCWTSYSAIYIAISLIEPLTHSISTLYRFFFSLHLISSMGLFRYWLRTFISVDSFLAAREVFVVKLCVLRIFMRYPSLFSPYTHLAVRKEERLLVVLGVQCG